MAGQVARCRPVGGELGLAPGAAARRLARAALERNARRLGLSRSNGLRLASRFPLPRSNGGRALRVLRFHQTASGLRVLWSQIDVTLVAGEVSSISARGPGHWARPAGQAQGEPCAGMADRAPGRSERRGGAAAAGRRLCGQPEQRAFWPWRRARPVWVVELELPVVGGEDAGSGICVVVDARTGKVVARSPGIADRPERGPEARGAGAAAAAAAASAPADFDPRTRESRPLIVVDGTGKDNPPPAGEDVYGEFRTTGKGACAAAGRPRYKPATRSRNPATTWTRSRPTPPARRARSA